MFALLNVRHTIYSVITVLTPCSKFGLTVFKKIDINDGKSKARRISFVLPLSVCFPPSLLPAQPSCTPPSVPLSPRSLSDESVVNTIWIYSNKERVWGLYVSMF